ncbi:alkaline phosphatase family protein [Desulfoluna spongiiphila]|uniref:Tetratricopeptide repeat-containing protein n=1 Tax=Desulfoluna spongiiphila TaxID=419481 RepID=A0A1G5CRZ0_9BACT|nr:alkaline phosphatase family protein [Desulfoluna spongiiphila]SCY05134.1 Tetratricopeptide repeat-containing protein [Desulfoluna spongiiphila]
MTSPSRVLVIGWDAADWKVITPLMDSGKMPNLETLVNSGVRGNLASLYPGLSPMLWTSIATGKRPFKHGILGFTEPDPHTDGIRPISNLSRKTKAIWNILGQHGMKSNVIGWWPSHPAEPINGVMVSNHYPRAVAPFGQPWPMAPGTVHPGRLSPSFRDLRLHPQELDASVIRNFVPSLAEVDQEKDRRIESLAKIIGDCTNICNAAVASMRYEPWDLTAVYFDAIDHFCHGFMRYHPPRLEWVDEADFNRYHRVVESGYVYHDRMLGRLLAEAGEETTVILISDHGFHSDHLRLRGIPDEPAGPAAEHRHYGVVAMKGPGIKQDELVFGATLLDICPTILTLFGLPVGEDMDGKPLLNAFQTAPALETIPSWDQVLGEDGSHPADRRMDSVEAAEAIRQLVDLGYIASPDADREKAVADTVRELKYNLACSYMDASRYADAVAVLTELHGAVPGAYRYGVQRVTCLQMLGQIEEARRVLTALVAQRKQGAEEAARQLEGYRARLEASEPLSENDGALLRKRVNEARPTPYAMEFLLGVQHVAEENMEQALVHLKNAEKADTGQPSLYLKLGDVYLKMRCWTDAETNFKRVLTLDPDNAEAFLGLSRCAMVLRRYLEAAEGALTSVGLRYYNPMGHFLLGKALVHMGLSDKAKDALKMAVSQSPDFPAPHRLLAHVYKFFIKDDAAAERHRALAREARRRIDGLKTGDIVPMAESEALACRQITGSRGTEGDAPQVEAQAAEIADTVVIVSGLPRSGTSMMMQMLKAGGMLPYTDHVRRPDDDNPKGYFECEKAKGLASDASWLPEAKGKTVKIVAQLLGHLPRGMALPFRVIFMERHMEEVIRSQDRMLERSGKRGADLSPGQLGAVYLRQVGRIKAMLGNRGIPILFIDYNASLAEAAETAKRVNAFLGGGLDEGRMAGAVDPRLYRKRAAPDGGPA